MSKYLNLPLTFLQSDRYLGEEPTTRSTCISLHVYCVGQENGGRIVGARLWKDRKCQQVLGVTREELDAETDLWAWEGDDAILPDYNSNQEQLAKVARANGAKGGRRAKTQPDKQTETQPDKRDKTQPEPSGLPDGLAKVKKGKVRESKVNHNTTASADAEDGEPEFYLTAKKRKLTGKRLEAFHRFWEAFAYPKGKGPAADAWLDIPQLTEALVDRIVDAARQAARERERLKKIRPDQTPQYAQGWLTQKRWEDFEEGKSHPTRVPDPAPPKWRAALRKFFVIEKMEHAVRHFDAGKYQSWREVDRDWRPEVIKIAKKLEGGS